MTVSTEVDHNEYVGNGVTTTFPYTFRIFQKSDLVVQVVDIDENISTLLLDTDYSVIGAGSYSGGSVILAVPLSNGWKISISRELPVTQETDLRNQGKFFAEVHEDAFDKLTMLLQQVRSWLNLALRKPSIVANYYDALNNRIRNLRDPSLDMDAVNKRTAISIANEAVGDALIGMGWQELGDWRIGLTVYQRNQIVWYDGSWYQYNGALPHTIAGASPSLDGGVWSEENPSGLWVNIGVNPLRQYIDDEFKHKITYLPDFTSISSYRPVVDEIVEIDGIQFKAQDNKSLNSAVPVISFANGKYAIPHKGSVTGLAYRFDEDSYITNAAFDGTNNYQGLEVDTVAGSVFYSRVTTVGAPLETCTVYEQAFNTTTMTAGAILKTVTNVPMGHGDYFAVVRNADGTRTILFGKPQTTTFGVTKIAKMNWDVANPVVTVTDLLDFTGSQYPARTNITWGSEGKFNIHAVNRSLFECLATDVLSGIFKPLSTVDDATVTNAALITIPSQNIKKSPVDDYFYALSGTNIRRARNSYVGITDSIGNQKSVQEIQRVYADTQTYEPETITWMWDSTLNRYKTIVGIYDYGAFKIALSSIDSGTKSSNATIIGPGFSRISADDTIAPAYQSQDFLQRFPGRIGAQRGMCPGSISIDPIDINAFNPFFFQMHNFAHGSGNRYGCRIRYAVSTGETSEILLDGQGDTTVGRGIRIGGSGWNAIAHFAPDGITFGGNRQTAIGTAPIAMLNVTAPASKVAIRASASSGLPAFHNASNGPTLTGTTGVALGLYSEPSLVYTELLRATSAGYTWNVPSISDRRVKFDINYLLPEDCLSRVLKMKPADYSRIRGKKRARGFIAQDANRVDRLLGERNLGVYGVHFEAVSADNTGAIIALHNRIEELSRIIKELSKNK